MKWLTSSPQTRRSDLTSHCRFHQPGTVLILRVLFHSTFYFFNQFHLSFMETLYSRVETASFKTWPISNFFIKVLQGPNNNKGTLYYRNIPNTTRNREPKQLRSSKHKHNCQLLVSIKIKPHPKPNGNFFFFFNLGEGILDKHFTG